MINQVIIEGNIQPGYKEFPAVQTKNINETRSVSKFKIISKYGPEEKFSSGIVTVDYWHSSELNPQVGYKAGDLVTIQGQLKVNAFKTKDGVQKYELIVSADSVELSSKFQDEPIPITEDEMPVDVPLNDEGMPF